MITVISMQEFKTASAMKCAYVGYVYDPKGWLFHVETRNITKQSSSPSFPFQNSLYYTNGTIFYETFQSTQITLQRIGDNDVVYDENGKFVCTKPPSDKKRKGQIYIWKPQKKGIPYIDANELIHEYIPIQDITLSAEVYSKIFTHIVSIEFKNDFHLIRNEQITVQVNRPDGTATVYNRHPSWESTREDASYTHALKTLAAVVKTGDSDNNTELYSTLWNILNLLGAHELVGHGVMEWWSDKYSSHHLTYLYQIGHDTFKNTTETFQTDMQDSYKRYINKTNPIGRENLQSGQNTLILRDAGFYLQKNESIATFTRNNIHSVQDTAQMKKSKPEGLKLSRP